MRKIKFIALLLILLSLSLFIVAGTYNPQSTTLTLSLGELKSIRFSMRGGESVNLNIHGTDYFTLYIMNESAYDNLENSNFTDSLYVNTAKNMSLRFTAPSSGEYYIVIANVNTKGYLQVVIAYGESNNLPILLVAIILGGTSIAVVIYDIIKSKNHKVVLDATCPNCGAPVNSEWNHCPNCGFQLRGGER